VQEVPSSNLGGPTKVFKELQASNPGGVWRVAFAFDPKRKAILGCIAIGYFDQAAAKPLLHVDMPELLRSERQFGLPAAFVHGVPVRVAL